MKTINKETEMHVTLGVCLAGIACCILFAILATQSCGCGHLVKTDAQKIEEAIAHDFEISEKYQFEGKLKWRSDIERFIQCKRLYVAEMYSYLADADLPDDFKTLHLAHVSAQKTLANELANSPWLPDSWGEGALIGTLNFLSGKLDAGVGEIDGWARRYEIANGVVHDTWSAVIENAIHYGARIQPKE